MADRLPIPRITLTGTAGASAFLGPGEPITIFCPDGTYRTYVIRERRGAEAVVDVPRWHDRLRWRIRSAAVSARWRILERWDALVDRIRGGPPGA